jgi:hypothetical protein
MWSTDDERPHHTDFQTQRTHLLVDDVEILINYLLGESSKSLQVDFILDNYGPELAHDLALADYLLSSELVKCVIFHAKPYPYFVSDAMIKDIQTMLDWFESHNDGSVREMGLRCHDHLKYGRLQLKEDFFWTSPLSFWEMDSRIRSVLEISNLVISKGDANYRRLAGDLKWSPTTPFASVVGYFPAPLLAMRVLKAELAFGLKADQINGLDFEDPGWQVNGNWAVIQFKR